MCVCVRACSTYSRTYMYAQLHVWCRLMPDLNGSKCTCQWCVTLSHTLHVHVLVYLHVFTCTMHVLMLQLSVKIGKSWKVTSVCFWSLPLLLLEIHDWHWLNLVLLPTVVLLTAVILLLNSFTCYDHWDNWACVLEPFELLFDTPEFSAFQLWWLKQFTVLMKGIETIRYSLLDKQVQNVCFVS